MLGKIFLQLKFNFLKRSFFPTLIIAFHSAAYQSLCNCFNLCIFKLFNFKPEYNSDDMKKTKKK